MTIASQQSTHREFTGRKMLAIMLAFFGTIIAANISLAVLSVRSSTGLVVKNAYIASQTFDRDTARLLADSAMGIVPHISYRGKILNLELADADGKLIAANSVELRLGKSVSAQTDVFPSFKPLSQGRFSAEISLPAGTWTGILAIELGQGQRWSQPIRLDVRLP